MVREFKQDRSAPVSHGVVHASVAQGGLALTETSHQPHTRLRAHSHAHPAITFVLHGAFTERFSARYDHKCPSLSVLIKPSGAEHTNEYSAAGARSFIVECAGAGPLFAALERLEPQVRGGAVVADLLRLVLSFREGAPDAFLLAEEVVWMLADGADSRFDVARARPTAPWLRRVRDDVRARCTTRVSLAVLAREADVHAGYLARAFRRSFGVSVGQYLTRCRLDVAVRALVASETSIGTIASELGFADQSHFTRWFSREARVSPARYRRATRELWCRTLAAGSEPSRFRGGANTS